VQVSADGTTWTTVAPAADGTLASTVTARYVRVTMTRADGAPRTGIREVVVNSPTA
jgi:hypothetical protein